MAFGCAGSSPAFRTNIENEKPRSRGFLFCGQSAVSSSHFVYRTEGDDFLLNGTCFWRVDGVVPGSYTPAPQFVVHALP